MATYDLHLNSGNNFVSIPLDMSGVSYEDDFRILFNPSLLNNSGTGVMYKFILGQGQGLFNHDGVWRGNLNFFDHTKSYWIFSSSEHTKTFNGASITPQSLTYTSWHSS